MQAFDAKDQGIGSAVPVPEDAPAFKEQLDQLLRQSGAEKVKIFIPVEQLKGMSPTQKVLFELRNRARVFPQGKQLPIGKRHFSSMYGNS